MVMSSKKVGKMVTADVDKALANITAATPKPDMKDAGAELKAATAGKNDLSFAEQFKYTRMAAKAAGLDPSKQTFTWKGKTYTTKMAGEGASRPAAIRRSTDAKPATPAATPTRSSEAPKQGAAETPKASNPYAAKANSAPFRAKPTAAAERRAKLGNFLTKLSSIYTPGAKDKPLLLTGEAAREANRRQGTIGGKAKGGKIDGCAVRGKTRARMK